MSVAARNRGLHLLRHCMIDVVMPQFQNRSRVTAAHAGCAQNPHLGRIEPVFQRLLQRLRPGQFAGQGIADPDRQGGWRRFAFLHHVKVGVECRDFVDLGHGQKHLLREGAKVPGGEMSEMILDQVQMLDQQIPAAGAVGEKRPNLVPRRIIQLAAFGCPAALAASRFPNAFAIVQCHHVGPSRKMCQGRYGIIKSNHQIIILKQAIMIDY